MTMSQIPPTSSARAAAAHDEAGDPEEIYYEGSPMVRGNLGKIIFWGIAGVVLLAAPILVRFFRSDGQWPAWWITLACVLAGVVCLIIPWLIVKSVRYRITNYRIDFERGIFGKKIDTLEMWHVDDIRFDQSFLDRMLGVGNIDVVSNDQTTPRLKMNGLPNPRKLFETLKQRVITVKRQRGVVKMDMGGGGGAIDNG
jgi:membrane protein YdbS with pleckstrin-like domain